jgi:hypothetical protein
VYTLRGSSSLRMAKALVVLADSAEVIGAARFLAVAHAAAHAAALDQRTDA